MPTMNIYMLVTDGILMGNESKRVADVFAGFAGFVGLQRTNAPAADLNVFMATEFYYGANARPKADRKKVEKLARTLSRGHGNSLVFPGTIIQEKGDGIKNRLPIYFNGNEVLLHSKRSWGGSRTADGSSGGAAFIAGEKDPTFTITVAGTQYTCGVEICMDHQAGDLAGYLAQAGAAVDLHFIVGNTVGADQNNLCGTTLSVLCNANMGIAAGMLALGSRVFDNAGTEVAHATQTMHEKSWTGLVF